MSEALKAAVMATFYCRPGIEGMIGYVRRRARNMGLPDRMK
ncbi:hypothetical protein [Streptomyces decoyicus]|uniref:Uncharacterized protein n=1 Tax=Streptomyces decoyicus TaxID=249567 RepID=A0ABZ1FCV7_9ACTN|nr:hypothetical protein [Streptomyces decoyicus]WSB68184.1 hypothetical protein OG863_09555 [Streptomyces decoyicus]